VFIGALLGACIGFLWYNAYPAQVFMGDTGSLALGGIIATLAILVRKELLIPVLCGIFLVENLSVMMQVSWFKYTKKKYGEGQEDLPHVAVASPFPEERHPREQDRLALLDRRHHARRTIHRNPQAPMNPLVILGAQESGVGAARLAQQRGLDVFVSDAGAIKPKYRDELLRLRDRIRGERSQCGTCARCRQHREEPRHTGYGIVGGSGERTRDPRDQRDRVRLPLLQGAHHRHHRQ
jgi:hypothetical protein